MRASKLLGRELRGKGLMKSNQRSVISIQPRNWIAKNDKNAKESRLKTTAAGSCGLNVDFLPIPTIAAMSLRG